MKKIISLTLVLLSTSVFAVTPSQVCDSLSFRSNQVPCLKIIRLGFISKGAASVCINASFDGGKNECLRAAVNKNYSSMELKICGEQSFDSNRTECMHNSGERHQAVKPSQIIRELKKELKEKKKKIAKLRAKVRELEADQVFSEETKEEVLSITSRAIRLLGKNRVQRAKKALKNLQELLD